jgi:hypothetical protein
VPEFEEIIAEVTLPASAIKLSHPIDLVQPVFIPGSPALELEPNATVKLVMTGLFDTEETETYEQAAERTREDADEDSQVDWHPSALEERMRPKERYVLRGSLHVTSVRLDVIG